MCALNLLGLDGNPWTPKDLDASGNNFITARCKVAFSGNYPTGGDALDLRPIAAYLPTNGVPLQITPTEQGTAAVPSLSAAGGFITLIQNAVPSLTNFLLKIFKNTAGSVAEYGAGAYGTDVTTDLVQLEITWRKFA